MLSKLIKSALIIEPNKYHAQTLAQALTQEGLNAIRHYANAQEGLEGLTLLSPGIIFVEADLEGRDGVSFIREVRRNPAVRSRKAPIFLMSSRASTLTLAQVADCGANMLIVKPIAPGAIGALIRKVLEHPRPFIDDVGYVGPCRRSGVTPAPNPCPARRAEDRARAQAERSLARDQMLVLLMREGEAALSGDAEAIQRCRAAADQLSDLALLLNDEVMRWIGQAVRRVLDEAGSASAHAHGAVLFQALGLFVGDNPDESRRLRLSAFVQSIAGPERAA